MIITHIDEYNDGVKVATITDDEGNVIGQNVYGPDSYPQPVVSGEETLLRRIQDWWNS